MIAIQDLVYEFPGEQGEPIRALDGITLTVKEGETVAVLGANGSGKTTLARCLNALYQPTSGSVVVDGLDTRDESCRREIRRRVGLLFQNPENQIVAASVEREIAFGLENLGLDRDEMRRPIDSVLDRFGLQTYRHHPPYQLSGGEIQRLAIAAVMAMRPSYLVLDEPTSLLDPGARKQLLKLLVELNQPGSKKTPTEPVTTVLITQYPTEALIANRVLVLHRGRIIYDEPPDTLFQRVEALHEIGLSCPIDYELYAFLSDHLSLPITLKDLVLPPIL